MSKFKTLPVYLKQVFTALPLATMVAQVEALLPWKIQPRKLSCG